MRKIIRIIALCSLAFIGCRNEDKPAQLATAIEKQNRRWEGKAVRIVDGDTFDLLLSNNQTRRIRLFGIDCPERGQPFYQVAKDALGRLLNEPRIIVEVKSFDPYRRAVAIVYRNDGTIINETLLRAGLTWHYTRYDRNQHWAALQRAAKQQQLGIWSERNPIAPWLWKRKR